MTKNEAHQKIKKIRLMPLFYHEDMGIAAEVMKAVFEGGINLLEFTNRGSHALPVFKELVSLKQESYPEALLGIGSIVDASTAIEYIEAGADFVVSPLLKKEVIDICLEREVFCIPGCATLSEINQAESWGAEIVKVFPAAQLGGPSYIKAIKGPCPWISVVVTGGVRATTENIKEWHDAGVTGFGMGSDLISKDMIEKGNYQGLTEKVKELADFIIELSA
jgi:2-dehydro-3-deoxyphosphogluconate aldolase/(4S)-4-hydroxy-2-oxoglutarate aldolase